MVCSLAIVQHNMPSMETYSKYGPHTLRLSLPLVGLSLCFAHLSLKLLQSRLDDVPALGRLLLHPPQLRHQRHDLWYGVCWLGWVDNRLYGVGETGSSLMLF